MDLDFFTYHTPDCTGASGRAWAIERSLGDALLGSYVVHLPQHELKFDRFFVGLVHLRSDGGLPPPELDYPEAEYEFMAARISPTEPSFDPKVEEPLNLDLVYPVNVRVQFHGIDDAFAQRILQRAVCFIVEKGTVVLEQSELFWYQEIYAIINGARGSVTMTLPVN